MAWWAIWWGWGIAALVFAILEVVLPSFIFLGFAIGAAITAILFLLGGPLASWMVAAPEVTILVFAVMALASWLGLRRLLGLREGQVKTFDRDINDD